VNQLRLATAVLMVAAIGGIFVFFNHSSSVDAIYGPASFQTMQEVEDLDTARTVVVWFNRAMLLALAGTGYLFWRWLKPKDWHVAQHAATALRKGDGAAPLPRWFARWWIGALVGIALFLFNFSADRADSSSQADAAGWFSMAIIAYVAFLTRRLVSAVSEPVAD
jgi:hypothetical protein